MWRCPHCGVPQAEAARCWVCRRSSTTCSTCRHFRASLAPDLGYCGLDAKRRPLTGLELRGCWEEGAAKEPVAAAGEEEEAVHRLRRRNSGSPPFPWERDHEPARAFVPVEGLRSDGRRRSSRGKQAAEDQARTRADGGADASIPLADGMDSWASRTSLFGDADR